MEDEPKIVEPVSDEPEVAADAPVSSEEVEPVEAPEATA